MTELSVEVEFDKLSFGRRALQWLGLKRTELYLAAEELAEELEYWMKANHEWQNRTEMAEKSLSALATQTSTGAIIDLWYEYDIIIRGDRPNRRGGPRDYSVYLEGYLQLGILQDAADYARSIWRDYLSEI